MKAFVFPGQGAQFVGMGKDLYENSALAKELFEKANDILGYRITDIMFEGTDEDLRQTKVTQPAVFLHSVISALCMGDDFKPEMTAGHSLGEFSALVAAGALSFEDGLKLVYARAMAMQKACEAQPSTMAAIIALPDEKVEEICEAISKEGEVVVAANYNCPGQIVISGSIEGINKACEQMKAAGAKRALPLKVGGAFHSPLMNPAKVELEAAINATEIHTPKCPVYQNVDALPHTNPAEIKANLVAQLTASVRWTQTVKNMVADGADEHPGEAQHAAQRFGRCHPVGIAIEEMGEDDAQKALGAVEDAAKGTRQQGNGHIVERILGCGLPQAQGAALAQDFAAGRLREFALQDQASRQHQQAAQHEPDPGKAEDGGRITGLNRKQAVAHLDERERRTPQHIAADGQQHREEGRPEDGVQFGRAGIFNVRHPLSGCGCRPGCRRRRMRWSSRRRQCPRRRSCPR